MQRIHAPAPTTRAPQSSPVTGQLGQPSAANQCTAARPESAVAYRRYVMPQHSTSTPVATDGEHARYNAYLRDLAQAAETSELPGERG